MLIPKLGFGIIVVSIFIKKYHENIWTYSIINFTFLRK